MPAGSGIRPTEKVEATGSATSSIPVTIMLNGDAYEVAGPLTVGELLARLAIDARRVAVEHNLIVLKRGVFAETPIHEGDHVEIVNFVVGG